MKTYTAHPQKFSSRTSGGRRIRWTSCHRFTELASPGSFGKQPKLEQKWYNELYLGDSVQLEIMVRFRSGCTKLS